MDSLWPFPLPSITYVTLQKKISAKSRRDRNTVTHKAPHSEADQEIYWYSYVSGGVFLSPLETTLNAN